LKNIKEIELRTHLGYQKVKQDKEWIYYHVKTPIKLEDLNELAPYKNF